MHPRENIVICGAGIAGASAAHYLSQAGAGPILLLDERPPLTLTSDRSTECYRNWWPDPEMASMMNRSIDLMEELAAGSANVFRMNRRGYVYLTADSRQIPAMQDQAARISHAGGGPLRVHSQLQADYSPAHPQDYRPSPSGADLLLGRALIGRHFPYVSETAVAALHVRRAGWLSAQQLGMHLLEQARARGVTFRSGRVTGVETQGGRVSGVVLSNGELLRCEVFVDAAGPFFKPVAALFGVDLPVEAEIHLKVAFEDHLCSLPRDAPLLIWNDPQVLPWQEDERALLRTDAELSWLTGSFPGGAHTRPEGSGESTTILMLWDYRRVVVDPIFPVPLDDQYPEIALRGLSTMLPGLRSYAGRATRPRLDGGYYIRTRENRPIIGPTPVEGAFVIGALSGFGIMSACAAGELLAAHVLQQAVPAYAAAFSLARYQDATYVDSLQDWNETGEL